MEYVISYTLKKSQFGSRNWYYELWASAQGKTQKIRPGNTPYKTKRETLVVAQQAVEDMQRFADSEMVKCACCGEPILIKDAEIVGDEKEVEYWCKECVELFESSVENSL